MIDKDILEGLAELNETDLKRIKLLVDNKLNLHKVLGKLALQVNLFRPTFPLQ